MSTRYNWILPENINHANILEALLKKRGISERETFLNPKLEHLTPSEDMFGLVDAAEVILEHVEKKSKIFIHGDFDVDGITATAISWIFLSRYLNANVIPFIPNRFDDGYGMSEHTIQKMIADGANLIISVDCGAKDIELVAKYSSQVDFVITDHHSLVSAESTEAYKPGDVKKVGENLISANAKAVVHPKINNPSLEICGAFVVWKLFEYIAQKRSLKAEIEDLAGLAALGTVCDVMSLVNENRTIVKVGLEKLKGGSNIGINSLCSIADIEIKELSVYHLGFVIGPRLNAAGRLESAMDSLRLLCTQEIDTAKKLSRKLNILNKERQDLTLKYMEIADLQISKQTEVVRMTFGEGWPEGIVGLIAGKLTDKYNTPVIIGSLKDGKVKSSARSIEGIHIANFLKQIDHLLIKHGGHELAAGLQFDVNNFDQIQNELNNIVQTLDIKLDKLKSLYIDLSVADILLDLDVVSEINSLEPFGFGNKTPTFLFEQQEVLDIFSLGKEKKHIKLFTHQYPNIEFIGFNIADEFRVDSKIVDLVCNLDINNWNGNEKISAKIVDWR